MAGTGSCSTGIHSNSAATPRLLLLVGGLVTASLLVACGDDSSSLDGARPAGDAELVSASLCGSWRSALDGDVDAAAEQFDVVHGSLHSVAASLTPMDRSLAGRFLESKAAVEENLDGDGPDLSSALESLLQLTSEAAATLGTNVSECTP